MIPPICSNPRAVLVAGMTRSPEGSSVTEAQHLSTVSRANQESHADAPAQPGLSLDVDLEEVERFGGSVIVPLYIEEDLLVGREEVPGALFSFVSLARFCSKSAQGQKRTNLGNVTS